MFTQQHLGMKLKELRVQQHLTQKEAAMKIGVSVQAFSKWETGDSHS